MRQAEERCHRRGITLITLLENSVDSMRRSSSKKTEVCEWTAENLGTVEIRAPTAHGGATEGWSANRLQIFFGVLMVEPQHCVTKGCIGKVIRSVFGLVGAQFRGGPHTAYSPRAVFAEGKAGLKPLATRRFDRGGFAFQRRPPRADDAAFQNQPQRLNLEMPWWLALGSDVPTMRCSSGTCKFSCLKYCSSDN